jgi:hypothetical protein
MPPNPRNVKFPNPFYVVLLLTSTFFAMTIMAWLVVPAVRQISEEDRAKGAAVRVDNRSLEFGDWIDRNAVSLLSGQFGVMLVTGVLAMGLDSFLEKRGQAK